MPVQRGIPLPGLTVQFPSPKGEGGGQGCSPSPSAMTSLGNCRAEPSAMPTVGLFYKRPRHRLMAQGEPCLPSGV